MSIVEDVRRWGNPGFAPRPDRRGLRVARGVAMMRRRAVLALSALGVAAILFLFVFPTRSYLAQRRHVAAAQHDLDVLRKQNKDLAAEAQLLHSRAEVERRARQLYDMMYPGDQGYRVIWGARNSPVTTVP